MNASTILLVADDHPHRLAGVLKQRGYRVRTITRRDCDPWDVAPDTGEVVLLSLPANAAGGLAWCREIRAANRDCRLCVLYDQASEIQQTGTLELGADAVLVEPVAPEHLIAQLVALARTCQGASLDDGAGVEVGPLRLDAVRRSAALDGERLDLTDGEFDLLHLLVRHPGIVLTRDMIYQAVRSIPYDGRDRSVDLRISRLRNKLGDDARSPRWIKSVRGLGYLLVPPAN